MDISSAYLWLKALHLISVIAWMAGLLYLPRLYVYHAENASDASCNAMLKVMEKKLLRYIMNPAMIASFIFGFLLLKIVGFDSLRGSGWMHAKITLVLVMAGFHGMLAKWRKDFESDQNQKSSKFFRYANEVPTVLMILIVILVVIKPF